MIKVNINELSIKGKGILLSDVNFEVLPNRVHTILGLNGTGKTTLIKSLTGLLPAGLYLINGSVLLDNVNLLEIEGLKLCEVRKSRVKYVFQDAVNSFDQLKTFEYYFDRIPVVKNEIDSHLEYFLLPQYSELKKLFPYEVSGGMAQRISFVLALLAHPEIIILDEPTSGIDPAISNLYYHKLREFAGRENNSVLLVTHDLTFTEKVSDEVAFLNDGSLSKFYTKEELFGASLNLIEGSKDIPWQLIQSYKQLAV